LRRQETQDKLDQLVRSDRRALLVAGTAFLAIAAVHFMHPYVSQRRVEAIVQVAYLNNNTETGQRYISFQAKLDDGRLIQSGGIPLMPPAQGERIVLRERVSWIGYTSYFWEGPRPE
jgi:hypothetical protein